MCMDVVDLFYKVYFRWKYVKKLILCGKKYGDESLEVLIKKYGSKYRYGKKMVIFDLIKYLQELEKGEYKMESNKEEKMLLIKKLILLLVLFWQNMERESESKCYYGYEVMFLKYKLV